MLNCVAKPWIDGSPAPLTSHSLAGEPAKTVLLHDVVRRRRARIRRARRGGAPDRRQPQQREDQYPDAGRRGATPHAPTHSPVPGLPSVVVASDVPRPHNEGSICSPRSFHLPFLARPAVSRPRLRRVRRPSPSTKRSSGFIAILTSTVEPGGTHRSSDAGRRGEGTTWLSRPRLKRVGPPSQGREIGQSCVSRDDRIRSHESRVASRESRVASRDPHDLPILPVDRCLPFHSPFGWCSPAHSCRSSGTDETFPTDASPREADAKLTPHADATPSRRQSESESRSPRLPAR